MSYHKLKFISAIIVVLISASSNAATAQSYETSEWFKSRIKSGPQKSGWVKDVAKQIKTGQRNATDFHIASGQSIACPNWYGYIGLPYNKEARRLISRELKKRVSKNLVGYPRKTIEACSKPNFIIEAGKQTNNPLNKKVWASVPSTLIIVDDEKTKGSPLRAFVVTDYLGDRSGGFIYNGRLQKICDFNFTSKNSTNMDCGVLGKGRAEFKITNIFTGDYQLFGTLGKRKLLATNMSPKKIRRKYPDLVD
jgi:hypothetical protein